MRRQRRFARQGIRAALERNFRPQTIPYRVRPEQLRYVSDFERTEDSRLANFRGLFAPFTFRVTGPALFIKDYLAARKVSNNSPQGFTSRGTVKRGAYGASMFHHPPTGIAGTADLLLPEKYYRDLGIASRTTFFRLGQLGLRILKVGGKRYIRPIDLNAFMEAHSK